MAGILENDGMTPFMKGPSKLQETGNSHCKTSIASLYFFLSASTKSKLSSPTNTSQFIWKMLEKKQLEPGNHVVWLTFLQS